MKLLELFNKLSIYPQNAGELKGLILQLAVKGKLTAKWREENSGVEPASELLKRIKSEKEKLIKEKKIKKEKPLPPIDEDEIPFDIPVNWEWRRLGDIINLEMGQSPDGSTYNDKAIGVPLINGPVEFGKGPFDETKKTKFTTEPTKMCSKGDLLICVRGATTGRTNIAGFDACIGRGVAAIQPYFYKKYLNYFILKSRFEILGKGTGTTFPSISRSEILNIVFPFPPLEEQQTIVDKVEHLFKEVEQLEDLTKLRITLKEDFATSALHRLTTAQNTLTEWNYLKDHFATFFTETSNVKKLRETILQLAVQGKLTEKWRVGHPDVEPASVLLKRIKGEKEQLIKDKKIKKENLLLKNKEEYHLFKLPTGWVWTRMINTVHLITKGATPTSYGYKFQDYGIKFIKVECVKNGEINHQLIDCFISEAADLNQKRSKLVAGDILFSIAGTIGATAIVKSKDLPANTNQALAIIRGSKTVFEPEFLQILLNSFVSKSTKNKARGGAMNNISLGDLKTMHVPLPPLDEQKAIVDKVDSLMKLCDHLEQQIETSHTQVSQLMHSCLREVVG